jgi:hypothetical protein
MVARRPMMPHRYFVLLFVSLSFLLSGHVHADDEPKLFLISQFGADFPQPGSVQVGFMNETGKVVIPFSPDYFAAEAKPGTACFAEGLEPVSMGLKTKWRATSYGYLDAKGNFAIEPQFEQAAEFSEGFAMAIGLKGPPWDRGYIDHTGKFVITPQFETARAFSGGLAVVRKTGDRQYGAIDHDGKWIVPAQYDGLLDFHEGLAAAAKFVAPGDLPPSATGPAPEAWGFIDITGKQVIDFKFTEPSSFSEGLAAINNNGTCGYIDKTGAYVIPPNFPMGWDFSEGVARVKTKDRKEAYIDKTGKVVFAVPGLTWAEPFTEGLAAAAIRDPAHHSPQGRFYGFIDHTGKFVIAPTYFGATPFHNGLAFVNGDGFAGYIDKTGRLIWQTKMPDMRALMGR